MAKAPGRPRLTGGHAGGRPLDRPVPSSARPTSGRVREAMFSLLGGDLEGQRVLDGFGGSGLLALEAWSRGAQVVCIEKNAASVRTIRANVAAMGADVEVVRGDLLRYDGEGFDGVLLDPPYALDPGPFLAHVAPRVRGWVLLEQPKGRPVASVPGLAPDRERCYGDTVLWLFHTEVG